MFVRILANTFIGSCILFHCHTLCKVSRLIHIQTLGYRHIVTQQLQRDHCQTTNEVLIHLRNIYSEVHLIFDFILAISSEPHQISATALALQHIADSLFVEFALGKHTDALTKYLKNIHVSTSCRLFRSVSIEISS